MLGWAFTFLSFALAAGYLGFFELAGLAANIARILLIVFVILRVVSAYSGTLRVHARPSPAGPEQRRPKDLRES